MVLCISISKSHRSVNHVKLHASHTVVLWRMLLTHDSHVLC
jgi:hypothetical protein